MQYITATAKTNKTQKTQHSKTEDAPLLTCSKLQYHFMTSLIMSW